MSGRRKATSEGDSLRGISVLVGRARHQASALSSALRELGADVIEIPFIEIRKPKSFRPLDAALNHLHAYDWLILTSVNGVEAMWERMGKLFPTKLRAEVTMPRIAAIGPATKKAIEDRGPAVSVVPTKYIAEAVVLSLRRRVKGKRVLLVRAKVARDVIPRELRKAGARVDVVEAYETVIPRASRSRLRAVLTDPDQAPHIIPFTSSSTVRNFVNLIGTQSAAAILRARPNAPRLASIGPVTSATLRQLRLPVDIEAEDYTIPGLIKAIVEVARNMRPKGSRSKS